MNPGRNMGKTNPLNDKDMAEFIELQKTKTETEPSLLLHCTTNAMLGSSFKGFWD